MGIGQRIAALALGLSLALTGCGGGSSEQQGAVIGAPEDAGAWSRPGRDLGDSYYSPLEGINADNVGKLGLAFEFTDFNIRGRTHHAMQSTPVMQDGTLYFSGPWGEAYAVDARTGEQRWMFDTEADGNYARNGCCGVLNRGVALADGKVFVGSLDGHLFAIDAKTGQQVWRADTLVDRNWNYISNGAPQIAGDLVIIGNAGADMGARGYVSAYNMKTGELAWRFWIVPGDPAKGPDEGPEVTLARKTWAEDSRWDLGLGGNAWNGISYDPETDTAFIGTGNGGPHPAWLRSKSGKVMDNLFLSSIVAVDAKTGKLKWYYQQVPGESWDFASTAPMVLADITIEGKRRKVLMQAPKNGVFYVLDRETGELLRADAFTRINWTSGVDMKTGRPAISPDVDYREDTKIVWPSAAGAHGWTPNAYSPRTGLVYIPTYEGAMAYVGEKEAGYIRGNNNQAAHGSFPPFDEKLLAGREPAKFEGRLQAWDPVKGEVRWTSDALPFLNGGTMVAGDLVFQGSASGYLDAYDAASGKRVAHIFLGTVMTAAPMTYELDGVQYLAILAGAGGPQGGFFGPGVVAADHENYQRLIVLKVGGAKIPVPPKRTPIAPPPLPKAITASPAMMKQGEELFMARCSRCHAAGGAVGIYPNLWIMPQSTIDQFDAIVGKGALSYGGMASFGDTLSPSQIAAIKAYVVNDTIARRSGTAKDMAIRQNQTH